MRLLVTALVIAATTVAAASAQTSSTVPRTPEEALQQLRRTQAKESDWSTFPDFTSVLWKSRLRQGTRAPIETDVVVLLHRNANGSAELEVLAERQSRTRITFDAPELDAARATFVRNETITAAGKTYATKVYSFEVAAEDGNGSVFVTRHLYWLAGGVPSGIVRHEAAGVDSGPPMTAGGTSVTVLSELDAPFTVQGTVLHTYCRATQTDLPDGTSVRSRVCKHASVPGGIVRFEERETENGMEVRYETTDLEEMTLPPPPGSVPKSDFGCTFPASMLGDVARRHADAGDFNAAVASFDALIRADPACARAFNDRGWAKLQLDDVAGAMSDFDRATALEPTLLMPYVNRAVVKRDNNDLKGALDECNAALKIDPASYVAVVVRMTVYFRLFDDRRALQDYERALAILPSDAASLDRVVAQERARRRPPQR